MPTEPTTTAATHDPWHGRNPWGCCQDRNTHGGPGCKWPGTETEPLTTPATAAVEALLRPHRHDCDCDPCVELRTNLAAIAEAERQAWRTSRDIFIR